MTRRPRGARGPRRFRVQYEEQVPARAYAWVKRTVAFKSPGERDGRAQFLRTFREIRNVETVDLPYQGAPA